MRYLGLLACFPFSAFLFAFTPIPVNAPPRGQRELRRAWEKHERLLAKYNNLVDDGIMPPEELSKELTFASIQYHLAIAEFIGGYGGVDEMREKYPIGDRHDTFRLQYPNLFD